MGIVTVIFIGLTTLGYANCDLNGKENQCLEHLKSQTVYEYPQPKKG